MAITMNWNVAANKKFESGLDRGVFYAQVSGAYPLGVAWEGLINITEKPAGAEVTDLWANNTKYAQLVSVETFDISIEAYTFPDEFLAALGIIPNLTDGGVLLHQQARGSFGLCYRTRLGSDAEGQSANYKLHIVYGLVAQPSEIARSTVNDSPEASTFTFEAKSTPASVTGSEPVSKITIDESVLSGPNLIALETALYGDDLPTVASLPLPDALLALLV